MPAPNFLQSSPVTSISRASAPYTVQTLIDNIKWGSSGIGTGATVYYSFPTSPSVSLWAPYYTSNGLSEIYNNFTPANQSQINAARYIFDRLSEVANINFVEVFNETATSVGDIRIANTGAMPSNTYAYAYFPNTSPVGGDIWFNNSQPVHTGNDYSIGARGYKTLIHEIGHALGLTHPFNDDDHDHGHDDKPTLSTQLDHYQYTVMSYHSSADQRDDGFRDFYPTTPMLFDIEALQFLYGANITHNTGDNIYSYSDDQYIFETIWDAGGTDTIIYSGQQSALINLNDGQFSSLGLTFNKNDKTTTNITNTGTPNDSFTFNNRTIIKGSETHSQPRDSSAILANSSSFAADIQSGEIELLNNLGIAYGATIENATTSNGNDIIYGNDSNNVINGGAGYDTFISNISRSQVTEIIEQSDNRTIIVSTHDTDTLISIEEITFSDNSTVSTEILNRTPSYQITSSNDSGLRKTLADSYTGPVTFLEYQLLGSSDNEVILGADTNDFINLLGGTDAADGKAGRDVIDGGTGSNFLIGGSGDDTFFIDGRGGQITWSTIVDFTQGDSVNIWGWENHQSQIVDQTNDGAQGYQGITLHIDLNGDGSIDTSITFTGLSAQEVANQQALEVAGSGYLLIT